MASPNDLPSPGPARSESPEASGSPDGLLTGGNGPPVERRGAMVHRQVGPWTPAIHRLLRTWTAKGIPEVPLVHRFDEQGREVLSFIPGTVAHHPWPTWLWSDGILRDACELLRRMHDAAPVEDFAHEVWQSPVHEPAEVICHNDFAPYNLVFRGGRVVGVIDVDMASPGPRIWDFAYLAYRLVPFAEDSGPSAPSDAERVRRLAQAIDSYGGVFTPVQVLAVMAQRLQELANYSQRRASEVGRDDLADHAEMYRRDAIRVGRTSQAHV